MNCLGTGPAKAWLATGEWSREGPRTPTSFSTCIMITVCVSPSTSRICFINAAKARESASRLASLRVVMVGRALPFSSWMSGNRCWLVLTHTG